MKNGPIVLLGDTTTSIAYIRRKGSYFWRFFILSTLLRSFFRSLFAAEQFLNLVQGPYRQESYPSRYWPPFILGPCRQTRPLGQRIDIKVTLTGSFITPAWCCLYWTKEGQTAVERPDCIGPLLISFELTRTNNYRGKAQVRKRPWNRDRNEWRVAFHDLMRLIRAAALSDTEIAVNDTF